jgi:hypothetical protein
VGGKYEINVCFWGAGTAAHRALAVTALTNTWDAFSGIDFVFKGDCGDNLKRNLPWELGTLDETFLSIKLEPGNPGGSTVGGKGGRHSDDPWVQVKIWYDGKMENFDALVVHEVGHALTLIHEHGRSDWPGRAEGIWTNPPPAANTTHDRWNCDRHNTNAAFFNDPAGYNLNGVLGYHPEGSGYLVLPVDPASIMSPWNCDPNRRAVTPPNSNFPNYWKISYFDALGIEIIYPFSFVRSIRGRNGIVIQDGIVVRGDDTLLTDWHFRGALTGVYKTTPVWTYGGTTKTTNELSVSNVGTSGTYSVSVKFQDAFSRNHSGTTSVVVNNSTHTALVMASLGI